MENQNTPLSFKYKNWKGKIGVRNVLPIKLWFGHTEFHTEDQWILKAWDLDKKDYRDFAVKDIIKWF